MTEIPKSAADVPARVLFIEFLKTLVVPNGPPRDVQQHLGSVLAAMAKKHTEYAAALQVEFGIDLATAQHQFVEHMKSTENDPQSRFAGTILMPRSQYKRPS